MEHKEYEPPPQHLLLYDGECGLCDGVVQAVLRRDHQKRFCFAPLQGLTAAKYLQQMSSRDVGNDSVILIDSFRLPTARVYLRSSAVWRVCWHLGGIWKPLGLLSFLPGWLFDWGYRIVARMRYRLFGRISCRIPPAQSEERFLP